MRYSTLTSCLLNLSFVGFALSLIKGSQFFEDERVKLVGRYSQNADGFPIAMWSNSAIRFAVKSDDVNLKINLSLRDCVDKCNFFLEAFVNCESFSVIEISQNNSMVELNLGTEIGKSTQIEVVKRTEAAFASAQGIMTVEALTVIGGELIPQADVKECFPRTKNLLVIGDSITAGYGDLGASPCDFSPGTESSIDAYAGILAKEVNAELHTLAWSGIGVVRNYGDANQVSSNPMPVRYNRTIPTDETSFWEPAQYQPHLVIVMLGTNDFSTPPQPSMAQFVGGLTSFVKVIESDYPLAQILLACAPMVTEPQCEYIEMAATQTDKVYFEVSPDTFSGGFGCMGHPSATTHRNMAQALLPVVQSLLGAHT